MRHCTGPIEPLNVIYPRLNIGPVVFHEGNQNHDAVIGRAGDAGDAGEAL